MSMKITHKERVKTDADPLVFTGCDVPDALHVVWVVGQAKQGAAKVASITQKPGLIVGGQGN